MARASKQSSVDKTVSIRLHKRLADIERLLFESKNVMGGQALSVYLEPPISTAIGSKFDMPAADRLAEVTAECELVKASWKDARKLFRVKMEHGMEVAIGQWLVSVRLGTLSRPLPPALSWKEQRPEKKGSTRLLQACPWPVLVLANRVTPATHEHSSGKQLLGVFVGDAKQWLASAAGYQSGDRGWGELCIRGGKSDYVLYELGRFAEMIVWGNPFVLEMLLIEHVKGGALLHATNEWRDLVNQFPPEKLLTARAIMQIMSSVQAQLKLLIAGGKPFGEEFVALADLLHMTRKVVVAKVGHSETSDAFNEWNFWKEPIAELEEEKTVQECGGVANERDGPACMPTSLVDVEANFNVDKTRLRECLVELDELRPKWSAVGVFPDASTVKQQLDTWFVQIRLASLNS